jgi:hypothetical protein
MIEMPGQRRGTESLNKFVFHLGKRSFHQCKSFESAAFENGPRLERMEMELRAVAQLSARFPKRKERVEFQSDLLAVIE